MTTGNVDELRRKLLLEQAVTRRQDRLVRLANVAVLRLENSDMRTSQLRNAVTVAQQEGASYDVVANFIRYKIATQKGAWGTDRKSFGHTVIDQLDQQVRWEAQQALDWLKEQPKFAQLPRGDEIEADLYGAMLKRYMGYIVRAFAYYEKSDDKATALKLLKGAADAN
jgi:hypothetical protein